MGDQEPSGLDSQERIPENRKRYSEIFRSLDAIEISIGNTPVDMFIGDLDGADHGDVTPEREIIPQEGRFGESKSTAERQEQPDLTVEEADEMLIGCDGGIDAALEYAKTWCKYVKELLSWMEKRLNYETDFAKGIVKIAESGRNAISHQSNMPLRMLYTMLLEQDIAVGNAANETVGLLHQKEFYLPLSAKKNEIEKWRKEFKEQWLREQKRMNESLSSLRKSRLQYAQRREELQRAQELSARAEDGPQGAHRQREKRRRSREEAHARVLEAEALYKACVGEARFRRQELERARARIVSHVRKLIYQGDEVLTWVTLRMFKQRQSQSERIPVGYQHLAEVCRPYKAGEKYLEFIRALPKKEVPVEVVEFEPLVSGGQRASTGGKEKVPPQQSGASAAPRDAGAAEDAARRQLCPHTEQGSSRSLSSDTESLGGSCESRSLDSPNSSPGNSGRKLLTAPSTSTTSSSDDFEERDPLQTLENDSGALQQHLRNVPLSSAAQSHRLRKLRGPSKCRECDTFMVNGFECEECYLACHKKCLETLLIACGHKRLPGRAPLFGIAFGQVPRGCPEEVPFLVLKCTSEIEARGLGVQGIYRISGSKARVEKLCQAFENGRDLVDLSEHSPHDITGVLKHFLKELSGPALLSQLYDDLISLARDLQKPSEERRERAGFLRDPVRGMRALLSRLPGSNYNTLRHLVAHLYRVAEKYEENKMSPANLGIVFGPTLLRPCPGGDVSMACLLDSAYQAQAVEFLILNYGRVFGRDEPPSSASSAGENPPRGASMDEEEEEGEQDPGEGRDVTAEDSPSEQDFNVDSVSDHSSSREATWEVRLGRAPSPLQADAPETDRSCDSDLENLEDPVLGKADGDSDTVTGTQPRGHFSRQPVKYIRTQAKTVIPKSSALPSSGTALELGAEGSPMESSSAARDNLDSGSSGNGSPATSSLKGHPGGKQQLQRSEVPQEPAGIVSRFTADDASASSEVSPGSAGNVNMEVP